MKYLTYVEDQDSYPIVILVNQIQKESIRDAYITPYGINEKDVIVYSLYQNKEKKKTPVKELKEYAEEVYSVIANSGNKRILRTNGYSNRI